MKEKHMILASASPRRRQLLELAGIPFEVIVSDAEEDTKEKEPGRIVEDLSFLKANAVVRELDEDRKDCIVLGADTIVWQNGQVMGKPKNEEQAREMIRLLQGAEHSVFTGVTLIGPADPDQDEVCREILTESMDHIRWPKPGLLAVSFHCETKVRVRPMDESEISGYIATGEPFDKAGGYGIQGPFAVFVESISGDYHNVVGLPVAEVYRHLKILSRVFRTR
ncbi:MAG: septum formation protein Maf [Lachnospiraceae bacterium]|nr:septum formation protein Maf [Lachnospiraceae bacterium]